MTNLTALDELIKAVEAGNLGPLNYPREMAEWFTLVTQSYNGSLDAAKALHDALLPGWGHVVRQSTNGKPCAAVAKYPYAAIYQYADNPARAWLLAILRAYRAQIGGAQTQDV